MSAALVFTWLLEFQLGSCRALCLVVLCSLLGTLEMVDKTSYTGAVPDLAVRQIFGRQKLPENLCLLMADSSLLSIERIAMLGDTISQAKTTLKAIVNDDAKFGADNAARELSLTLLAAVESIGSPSGPYGRSASQNGRRPEQDPGNPRRRPRRVPGDVRLSAPGRHPHLYAGASSQVCGADLPRLHGARLRQLLRGGRDAHTQRSTGPDHGLQQDLRGSVVQRDNKAAIAAESDVLDRLHAFFVALEYLNICDFTFAAGPLRYLSELEEWRHENRGLSLLLSVDNLIRKKVVKLNSDKRKFFPTFSDALLEVLKNHKQLWNDARSSAEVEKFQQAEASAPQTPSKRGRSPEASTPPPNRPPGSRARKNKLRRERQKEMVKKYKEGSKGGPYKPADKNTKVPDKEWKTITSFKYNGRRRCPFYTTARWGAASGISARTCTLAFSAARRTTGTATTERLNSPPLGGLPFRRPWKALQRMISAQAM